MSKLAELQLKKAALAEKIEQQRKELKLTVQDIREEIEPAKLLQNAVSGVFSFSNKGAEAGRGLALGLPKPVSFLLDLLVRDPKWALGLKLLTPVVMKFLPHLSRLRRKPEPNELGDQPAPKPMKAKLFAGLRKGISKLRKQLKKD